MTRKFPDKVVQIIWQDAQGEQNGWEPKKAKCHNPYVSTIGYLVNEDKHAYYISTTICDKGERNGVMQVPKGLGIKYKSIIKDVKRSIEVE